jgi:hypothetical protein
MYSVSKIRGSTYAAVPPFSGFVLRGFANSRDGARNKNASPGSLKRQDLQNLDHSNSLGAIPHDVSGAHGEKTGGRERGAVPHHNVSAKEIKRLKNNKIFLGRSKFSRRMTRWQSTVTKQEHNMLFLSQGTVLDSGIYARKTHKCHEHLMTVELWRKTRYRDLQKTKLKCYCPQ